MISPVEMAALLAGVISLLPIAAYSQQTAPPKEIPNALKSGQAAFADGLPEVAVRKLQAFLQSEPAPQANARRQAVITLARALLATRRPEDALMLLVTEIPRTDDGESRFWRARAHADLGQWQDALADYALAENVPGIEAEARFGCGETLAALGRTAEASSVFGQLSSHPALGTAARLRRAGIALETGKLDEAAGLLTETDAAQRGTPGETQERACLLGRLCLARNQFGQAEQIFSTAATHLEGLSERLLTNLFQGWAKACAAQGRLDRAEDVLENFIRAYPRLAAMPAALAWLEQLYAANPALDDLVDLRQWSADEKESARQALATLALARCEDRSGRPERAETTFAEFIQKFPRHPLRVRAWLELASLYLRDSRLSEARQALAKARELVPPGDAVGAETDALDARIRLAGGDFAGAARQFESIAERAVDPAKAETAAFNAMLGWLRAADSGRAESAKRGFEQRYPQSRLTAECALEEGLARAARASLDDPISREGAAARLRSFLRENPNHPRAPAAHLALAELAFLRQRPNLAAAWRQTQAAQIRRVQNPATSASSLPPSPDADAERAEYLSIWLADTPGPTRNVEKAIDAARKFLERRPDSPLAAEARMKLCDIYFRNGDYPDAQTQLELLMKRSPSSPLVEQAHYLAGLAAANSMSPEGLDNAVGQFEMAARLNGPFKLLARMRQAEAQNRLHRGRDALTLYDGVIAATDGAAPSDATTEVRCAALSGRGETLLDLAGADPKLYAEAVRAFTQLQETAGASLSWRRQALTKKGHALEKSGDPAAALAAYYDALESEPLAGAAAEAEWTWYYRAGTDAAGLLEAQNNWPSAIAIYQKLAAADGPLKRYFESLLSSRRLEHFVW